MPESEFGVERIVVVGLGLIGGSIALALSELTEVVGVEPDPSTADLARSAGIAVAALDDVVHDDVIVVVATPVLRCAEVFARLGAIGRDALVTDVASVKAPVVAAARAHGLRFVGGHPMAGSEHSGFAAATDSLFSGARWALALDDAVDLADMIAVARVVLALGAGMVPVDPEQHDRAVALVSHLPHVYAADLAARSAADGGALALGLAAGSFRDGTRVARSPAEFWAGVLRENAGPIVPLLRDAARTLESVADALDAHDDATVVDFFARGGAARRRYEDRTATGGTLRLGADAASDRSALLELGRRGGFVTKIDGDAADVLLHTRTPTDEEPA